MSCTLIVSITGSIIARQIIAQSIDIYIVLPLFAELLLSVGELLFLHPGLSQRILISTLLMLHLEKNGRQRERRK